MKIWHCTLWKVVCNKKSNERQMEWLHQNMLRTLHDLDALKMTVPQEPFPLTHIARKEGRQSQGAGESISVLDQRKKVSWVKQSLLKQRKSFLTTTLLCVSLLENYCDLKQPQAGWRTPEQHYRCVTTVTYLSNCVKLLIWRLKWILTRMYMPKVRACAASKSVFWNLRTNVSCMMFSLYPDLNRIRCQFWECPGTGAMRRLRAKHVSYLTMANALRRALYMVYTTIWILQHQLWRKGTSCCRLKSIA